MGTKLSIIIACMKTLFIAFIYSIYDIAIIYSVKFIKQPILTSVMLTLHDKGKYFLNHVFI